MTKPKKIEGKGEGEAIKPTKEELNELKEPKAEEELEGVEAQPIEQFSFIIRRWRIISQQKADLEKTAELDKRLMAGLPKGSPERKVLLDEAKKALEQIPRIAVQLVMLKRDLTEVLAANPGIRNRVENWTQVFPNLRYPVARGLLTQHKIDVSDMLEKVKEIEKLEEAEAIEPFEG